MGVLIGIDLGTTNSCMAYMKGDDPEIIPNTEGSRTTPSIVTFTEGGDVLVGQLAKRAHVANAQHTIFAVKRLMGRKFDDEMVQQTTGRVPYKIISSDNGDAWVKARDKQMSPVEVSAIMLRKLKEMAEDYLGEEVTDTVITVPAYFDDSQRQATRDAGKIAGLEVRRIVNEPTAAALAYGLDREGAETVAVYDLGGGTFDISILQLENRMFQVKATSGDTFLGGEDFDNRLLDYVVGKFRENTGIDLSEDKMGLQRVKEAVEKAKMELSSVTETEISIPFIAMKDGAPVHLSETVSRAQLEKLTRDLVERTLEPCRAALKDAGITPQDVDHVILVGGQTRMPLVQKMVGEFFGKKPFKGINPDEVVALGAAIQGAIVEGKVEDVLLLDVTPLSLGVETSGGLFTVLIPRNTPIPTKKTEVFTTAVDNQPFVNIHVMQGERPMAADNKSLAHFQLTGIPPAPRGVPQIEVTFEIDSNGIVSVTAKDLGTGKSQSVKVQPTYGLTEDEIERIAAEAEAMAEQDRIKKRLAELRNELETLIYTTEQAMEEYGDQLTASERDAIMVDLEQAQKALDSSESEVELKDAFSRLEQSSKAFMVMLYGDL